MRRLNRTFEAIASFLMFAAPRHAWRIAREWQDAEGFSLLEVQGL